MSVCKEYSGLELLRYEMLAIKAADDFALDKAMDILISGTPNRETTERAVELLEGYFISAATKTPSVRILASLSSPARKEYWVQKIASHYKALITVTSFDPIAAVSLAGFCSAVHPSRKEITKEEGIRALAIAILRTPCSRNILLSFERANSLEMLLGTGTEERYFLALSMHFDNIERAVKILRRTENRSELTNTQPRRSFTSVVETSANSIIEEDIPLLADLEAELEQQKTSAQERVRDLFYLGKYQVAAYKSRAVKLYGEAADNGDMVSAYHLGLLHEIDGPEMWPRSVELYTRAMNGGIHVALISLAGLYADGQGVAKNPSHAVELYTRAIEERGDVFAMYNLALIFEKGDEGVPADLPRAVQLSSRAVAEGADVDSMLQLAYWLETGPEGVPKDVPRAARLYERVVAESGEIVAKQNLALLLENGADGIPADLKRAIALYEDVVDNGGKATAMLRLGQLYLKGRGVPADGVRARQLFLRALRLGAKEHALVHLADVYVDGAVGVPQSTLRAVNLYNRAIKEHGSGDAMFKLARLLETGEKGVPPDSVRAFKLYKRAASEKNHDRASRRLKRVEKQTQVLEEVRHMWSK